MCSVLLLGDEKVFFELVQLHLFRLGHAALPGPLDPARALDAALDRRPDLMAVDLAAPAAFVSAADEARRRLGIPVVHLTGRADDARIDAARATAPDSWVDDVGNPRELRAALEVALRHAGAPSRAMDPRTDRLASLGAISAAMAHEINNPLTWVVGNLALAIDSLTEVRDLVAPRSGAPALPRGLATRLEGALRGLGHACEGAERIRRIVADLRDFSGPDELDRRPVDVRAVVDGALRVCGNELRHRATVVREFRDVPRVMGSPTQLGQVFLNLLVNAAQALPAGQADAHEILVRVFQEGDQHVAVEVRDSGAGISSEHLDRIFEPFFTTRPLGEGRGMGLAVAHGIVQDHGGDIRVQSRVGDGSTFKVCLPIDPASLGRDDWTDEGARLPMRRGRIVVVDDEPLVLDVVGRLLEGLHDVETYGGGDAALARLLGDGPPVDAVLCDLMMPDTPGMEVWARVREVDPALADRIVFVTGGAFTDVAMRFLQEVPNPRLEKPFEVGRLFAVIQRVVG